MSASLKPRTTTVVLFQGDDLDKIRAAQAKVEEATSAAMSTGAPKRLGDSPSVVAAVEQYDAFMDECAARGVSIELQAVGRKVWRDILAKHAPRKVTVKDDDGVETEVPHPDDEGWGFNYETLADDLVPASVVDKTSFDEAFLDSLADGDWSKLYSAAVLLNQGAGPDPTLRLRTRLGPTSSETSESPARSA